MNPAAPVTRTFILRVNRRPRAAGLAETSAGGLVPRGKSPTPRSLAPPLRRHMLCKNGGNLGYYDKKPRRFPKSGLDWSKTRPLSCFVTVHAHVHRMKIKAYLKPSCGWSNGVRAILRKHNLPYEDIDIIN